MGLPFILRLMVRDPGGRPGRLLMGLGGWAGEDGEEVWLERVLEEVGEGEGVVLELSVEERLVLGAGGMREVVGGDGEGWRRPGKGLAGSGEGLGVEGVLTGVVWWG